MRGDIYIEDLAKPVYTEAQRAALAYGESLAVDLSARSIMREASDTTGLTDWGPDDFLERLNLLCEEWNADRELTGLGRLTLRGKLVQHATSRLLIRDTFKRHPEIHEVEIERPIIVAGLPRSGTTHLLNLMAADSRLRALPLWESYEPVPRPGEPVPASGADPRYERCEEAWQRMQAMTPLLAAMHPMNPDHIHEELELMGPNFGSYNYEWLSHSPRWRDHYLAEDQTYQYEYMKDVLRLLTWRGRASGAPTRWVLKCPQHLEQLPVLRRVFPDATVAITHRDPVAVIQSAITMLAYGQRMNRGRVMMEELPAYWIARVEHLLRACVRDRDTWPAPASIDIPFQSLTRDTIGAVADIYTLAGLPLTDRARAAFEAFSRRHREDYGRVRYDLRAQFGLDPEALRERFRFYFEAFPFLEEGGKQAQEAR